MAKEKAQAYGKAIREYARTVANGNASIRMVALVAGIMLCVDSLASFGTDLLNFHLSNAMIDFYSFAVGFAAVVMESDREALPYATKMRAVIGKNFGFARTVTGRGIFYGVAATLELSEVREVVIVGKSVEMNAFYHHNHHHQHRHLTFVSLTAIIRKSNRRSKIIGTMVFFVGVAYIVLGRMAHEKITKIRKQNFSDKKIKEMFENYDKNENGTIEFDEFKMMLGDLNLELSMQEAEVLYLSIDKDMNHGLKLEEFQKFWSTSDELDTFTI